MPSMNSDLKKLLIEEYLKRNPNKIFSSESSSIPVSGKIFDEQEIILATEAILDGWWTEGKYSEQFEQRLSKWLGVRHATLVNSGSSANLLAVSALMSKKLGDKRLKKGDEVITVAAGFPSTVNPIIQNGLIPVFVDIELGTYNIDINELRKALSDKTRAICIAHTLGNPFDLNSVLNICKTTS